MAGIPRIPSYPMPTRATLPANVAQWTVDPERAVFLVHDMQSFFLKPLPSPVRDELVSTTSHCCASSATTSTCRSPIRHNLGG